MYCIVTTSNNVIYLCGTFKSTLINVWYISEKEQCQHVEKHTVDISDKSRLVMMPSGYQHHNQLSKIISVEEEVARENDVHFFFFF